MDRQTDGRTDRILIARPHLNSMQRGKNTMSGVASNRYDGLGLSLPAFERDRFMNALQCNATSLTIFRI